MNELELKWKRENAQETRIMIAQLVDELNVAKIRAANEKFQLSQKVLLKLESMNSFIKERYQKENSWLLKFVVMCRLKTWRKLSEIDILKIH